MSHIFQHHNQMIIRFPQHIAKQLNQYFDQNPDQQIPPPTVEIINNLSKSNQCQKGVALTISVNKKKYPATVMELPTVISTFKTLDRVNLFKSNDISQLILVHKDQQEQIRQDQAQQIIDPNTGKIQKYKMRSGLTKPTKNIRQRNFKSIPTIEPKMVQQVDKQLEEIRQTVTSQNKAEQRPLSHHKQNRLKKLKKSSTNLKKSS